MRQNVPDLYVLLYSMVMFSNSQIKINYQEKLTKTTINPKSIPSRITYTKILFFRVKKKVAHAGYMRVGKKGLTWHLLLLPGWFHLEKPFREN
jgi:hypothetical protein